MIYICLQHNLLRGNKKYKIRTNTFKHYASSVTTIVANLNDTSKMQGLLLKCKAEGKCSESPNNQVKKLS